MQPLRHLRALHPELEDAPARERRIRQDPGPIRAPSLGDVCAQLRGRQPDGHRGREPRGHDGRHLETAAPDAEHG